MKTRIADKRHDLKVKGQGHEVSLTGVGPLLENENPRNIKIGRKVAYPTRNNVHQFQGQNVKG